MSLIVKNSQLTEETISALNQLIEMDINAVTAFKLTRIIKELNSIVEDKIKMERKILDKWTQKDEEGNPSPALDESGNVIPGAVNIINPQYFSEEMNALMDIESEIPFDKVNFEDLDLKTAKIKDLIKIEFLFD